MEKEKEAQGLFSFLPKIEVLSRTSLEILQDVLVLSRAMWNLSGGKNFLKRQRVCSCTGVYPYGCEAFMGVQPYLESLYVSWMVITAILLALDLTSTKNRRVHQCGRSVSSVLLSRIFFFRVKTS